MSGSPKKKRLKCKATDLDPKALEGVAALAKRVHAQSQSIINQDDSQHPRQTGCAGAGTGGRGSQLEKIGAILHAPSWTSQSKGATSLNPDAPANPLTPEPSCKSHSKIPFLLFKRQPPPPYSPSQEVSITTSKSHSKKTKTPIISAPAFELSQPQPTFSQWEAGG
ncbi:hypothetical protein BDR06DRAFT_1029562 [Suillus hirtellus]|nr:hypothetical protein BDR06DRAFT_1029562 [Suillus hirtellus]